VTVVTPTLNAGWRLQRCLDSVRAQTYASIEHIVMDAGSTDGSLAVLKQSSTRWASEPDEGQSDAINKGFALAQGSLLTWLNADDVLLPEAVETAIARVARADVDWVYGDVVIVDGDTQRVLRPPQLVTSHDFRITNPMPQPGTFMTREALDRVGPLDTGLHYAMDIDLWLRLLRLGMKGGHSGARMAVFEVHAESKGGSVPLSEFLVDTARACLRSGHPEMAAAYAGRAAAHRAADTGGVGWSATAAQLDRLLADDELAVLDPRGARGSARSQIGLLGARRRRLRATGQVLHPSVWADPLARALLGNALRRT
jgi:hypothetical protein